MRTARRGLVTRALQWVVGGVVVVLVVFSTVRYFTQERVDGTAVEQRPAPQPAITAPAEAAPGEATPPKNAGEAR